MKKAGRLTWKFLVAALLFGVVFVGLGLPYYKLGTVTNSNMLLAAFGVSIDQGFVTIMYKLQNITSNGAYDEEVAYWERRMNAR